MSCAHHERVDGQCGKSFASKGHCVSEYVLVEKLAEDASLSLLVRHTLTTSGVLVVLCLLEGFEGRHPAGALNYFTLISHYMRTVVKSNAWTGKGPMLMKKLKERRLGMISGGYVLVGEAGCWCWWEECFDLVRS